VAREAVQIAQLRREFTTTKRFRRAARTVTALDGIDLRVFEGEVLGLLGPNGAGKTTLVKVVSTVLLPTSGTVEVFGHDVTTATNTVRRLLGIVLGGERGLYGRLTARQNLRYWAALYHLLPDVARRRTDELLERVGLHDRADDPVETYSRGMKQRLHLARGLIGDPRLVLLDEPTTGMDPVGSSEFRTLVRDLHAEGRTILITTHDMSEAEALCDRVALIDHGRLLAVEEPRVLGRWIDAYERIDAEGAPEELLAEVERIPGVTSVSANADGSSRVHVGEEGAAQRVLERLVSAGITSLRTSSPTLEEVYLHVFGDRGMRV
jgi:ABC-2 type transport system ATP-binding protein